VVNAKEDFFELILRFVRKIVGQNVVLECLGSAIFAPRQKDKKKAVAPKTRTVPSLDGHKL